MAKKIPTWAWVLIGAAAFVVLLFIALVGAGVYVVVRHVDVQDASPASAASELDATRERFKDQTPLIEVSFEGDDVRTRVNRDVRTPSDAPLEYLHVMAYDSDDDKLVRVAIPFWLMRLTDFRSLRTTIGDSDLHFERLNLTVADLERRGPGLIIDHRGRRGARVLIWTE